MKKVWFITGASRGIGHAIAKEALAQGDCVIATARKNISFDLTPDENKHLLVLPLDITSSDEKTYQNAVKQGIHRFGRIDVLVNNAGHGQITNFEETSEENLKALFEVNLFGMMRITRAILPIMRQQQAGHILNIASGAGYSAGPVGYHTSKFAVTGFSVSLAFEVQPFGIKVTNVAPGLFRTNFYDVGAMQTTPDVVIPDYDNHRWQTEFIHENRTHNQPGDPDKLAKLICEVVKSDHPPLHLPVGADAVQVLQEYAQSLQHDCNSTWGEKARKTAFVNTMVSK